MLDEKICSRCVRYYYPRIVILSGEPSGYKAWVHRFMNSFKVALQKGSIICPTNVPADWVSIANIEDAEYPEWCPYRRREVPFHESRGNGGRAFCWMCGRARRKIGVFKVGGTQRNVAFCSSDCLEKFERANKKLGWKLTERRGKVQEHFKLEKKDPYNEL